MADKRFRGRDKIVQKMTKDGLVEENLRTRETKSAVAEEPPKQEDSEKDAAESAEESPVVEEDVCMDAEDGEEEKPRRSTAKQSTEYYKAHQEDSKPKEKDAPPVDEDAEPAPKKKGRLSFDDEQQGGIVRGAGLGIKKVAKKGVDTATGFAHNKVHQVEKENSGVESAHRSEETLEGLYRFSKGRKKTREKSARAEKKVEAEKKSSRLKFSENEGGITEEAAEMTLKKKLPQEVKQQRQSVQSFTRKSSIRMPMQQPSGARKPETLLASRRQRQQTRLQKKQRRRCRRSLCRTRPSGRDLALQH